MFKILKAVRNRFGLILINNSNSEIITMWNNLNRKAAMYKHSWRLIYCSESPIQYPLVGSVNARRITMNVNDSLKCGWPLRQRLRRVDYGGEGSFHLSSLHSHTHTLRRYHLGLVICWEVERNYKRFKTIWVQRRPGRGRVRTSANNIAIRES